MTKKPMTAAQRKKRRAEVNAAYFRRLTPEQRAKRRAQEKARREREAEESRIRFHCPRCGGDFVVPRNEFSQQKGDERFFVRLGGATVCEACANARFRRRHKEWGISPDAIPHPNGAP